MTDVSDFAGVSSGATTLLASGTVNAALGGGFTLTAQNVPATVRSILALILPTAVTNNAETYSVPVAKGNNSQVQWRPLGLGSGWPVDAQAVGVITPGIAMSPLYFPFYGQVDTAVTISWAVVGGGGVADQVRYWLVGLPDSDIAGSTLNPLSVTNGINPSTGIPSSVDVTLVQKDTQTSLGAVGAPVVVAISDSHPANAFTFASTNAASGAAAAPIMANPAAGQGYEIAAIHIGTTTLPTASNQQLQVRSHTTGQFLLNKVALAGQPIDGWITYPPGFVLGEGLDLLNTGIGVTGFVTVLRRTVTVG